LDKNGNLNLWWIPADGSGDPQRLTESKSIEYPRSWTPDGKVLAFRRSDPATILDILTLSIEGDEKSGWKPGEPKPFLNSPILEEEPAFSPDGRWIAYTTVEAGAIEVYVRPFPGPGGKWQISVGGGGFAKWSRNGKELFYRNLDNRIMVVNYAVAGDSFRADKPQLWSPGQFTGLGAGISSYDLHPDGKRFAVLKASDTEETATENKLNFVLNWTEELKQRVPTETK
jgi:eukaryotic-like serine/threonine-protein kinase